MIVIRFSSRSPLSILHMQIAYKYDVAIFFKYDVATFLPTLVGLCDEASGLFLAGGRLMKGLAESINIVAVHNNGVPAKGLHASTVGLGVVLQGSGLTLAKPRQRRKKTDDYSA